MFRAAALALMLTAGTGAATEVDVELVLLADTTGSIDEVELRFQRQGYAQAITDPRVVAAIRNTLTGRIALTYVEWGAADSQAVVVPWTVIETEGDARAFAAALIPPPRMAYGRNGIGAALLKGKELIETNDITGLRRVIDFSGDSALNRTGIAIAPARAEVLAAGITINGLAVLCRMCAASMGSGDLVERFENDIIGGPGAFLVAAETADQFTEAVRRKLILEISGQVPEPRLAEGP
jgi:hypothetical protein